MFKNLNLLKLQNNSISGPLPISFGEMKSLYHVDLSRNKINGSFPTSFGALAGLSYVDISQNAMHGVVLPEIHFANLTKLAYFFASGNHMVFKAKPDWVPSRLIQMLNLESCSNCLEGPLPTVSSNLTFLDLSNNLLSGNLVKFLCFNPSEKRTTQYLNLQGEIPRWMGKWLSKLSILNLRANKFHGSMPVELYHLQFVQILDLSHNSLSGSLPACLGNFSAMATSDNSDDVAVIYIFTRINTRGGAATQRRGN
ncbi:unnamed protein product [Linum tenue]|uniref:Uncharacterized protein n=1 Tax=Linum tenue TaxID=586396 RepID=A0AAV0N482_9ROSI|nr:unnamed protein product [Linum tenue]